MALITFKATLEGDKEFFKEVRTRIAAFEEENERALAKAAQLATQKTRRRWTSRPSKRPVAPPRNGRFSTGGQMASSLQWRVKGSGVSFNEDAASRAAPHWIIQEIGTDASATIHKGGQSNPKGRPAADAEYVRTVRAQHGRRLPSGLQWGSGGKFAWPSKSIRNQQLYETADLENVPVWNRRRGVTTTRGGGQMYAIRIDKEIKGRQFVAHGGKAGFQSYKDSLRLAARTAFERK